MFGDKVRQLRILNNMTQKELAEKLGVSARSLINYETGRCYPRQASVVSRLAEALHVSADYLLSEQTLDEGVGEAESTREVERLVRELSVMFVGGRIHDKDRDAAMEAILQAYWDGRRLSR